MEVAETNSQTDFNKLHNHECLLSENFIYTNKLVKLCVFRNRIQIDFLTNKKNSINLDMSDINGSIVGNIVLFRKCFHLT